jgi:hypothetical protein
MSHVRATMVSCECSMPISALPVAFAPGPPEGIWALKVLARRP